MYIYDFIIIGGGMGGLNSAYNLSNFSNKILLLDERKYLGGRILTYYENNFHYELGAGRFNNKQKILLKLIKDFNLTKIEINDKIDYIDKRSTVKPNIFNIVISKIINKLQKINKIKLKKYTFKELCYKYYIKKYNGSSYLSLQSIKQLINYFGYKSEFEILNAFNAIKTFNLNFNKKNKFYFLKEGLTELCNKLRNICLKNNVKINLSSFVNNIYKNNNLFIVETNNNYYYSKNIIFAVKKNDLLKFKILNPITSIIKSVKSTPLLRIYAYYPIINNKVWFENLNKIVTNTKLKFIIPINKKIGIIMISYTDYKDTKPFIENNKLKNNNIIINIIGNELKKIFNIDIPNPIKLNSYYWINGCHYWKKNYDSEIISKSILNPIDNIYICGETYSLYNQAWIEGALETSNKVCNIIIDSIYKN